MIINLPFDGFYNTLYSDGIDREEESFIEYRTDCHESDNESYWPEPLQLDGSELQEILFSASDYDAAYRQIARDYVECFDYAMGELLGMTRKAWRVIFDCNARTSRKERYDTPSIGLKFESMTSPREYNFETDRIFAEISLATVKKLFALSKADNHATFAEVIKQRFTSYDGFISHYSNRLSVWLEKPLKEWDHNELGTLLMAAIEIATGDPENLDGGLRDQVYEMVSDGGGFYSAWEKCVRWDDFERERMERRAGKLAEWIEEDREAALKWRYNNVEDFTTVYNASPELFKGYSIEGLPYRCPETPDMFQGGAV